MNQLFIIGNGFDLAHGLATSYKDFILYYAKKNIRRMQVHTRNFSIGSNNGTFIDSSYDPPDITRALNLEMLNSILGADGWEVYFNNIYWKKLIHNFNKNSWVDIERFYFDNLCAIYESGLSNKTFDLDPLNNFMDELKAELIKYLASLPLAKVSPIPHIVKTILPPPTDKFTSRLFLNFNYTATIENYITPSNKCKLINIHGSLNDPLDEIIFGYGDEIDPHYEKFEYLNDRRFLINSKSNGYVQRDDYKQLNSFLGNLPYQVIILGHSCGISDKILLSNIFQPVRGNCVSIQIFYYQYENGDDFTDKFMEITRHFPSNAKHKMRLKVISKQKSSPLVPFQNSK